MKFRLEIHPFYVKTKFEEKEDQSNNEIGSLT